MSGTIRYGNRNTGIRCKMGTDVSVSKHMPWILCMIEVHKFCLKICSIEYVFNEIQRN